MSTASAAIPANSNRSDRRRYLNQLRIAYLYASRQVHIAEAAHMAGVTTRTIWNWQRELMSSDDPDAVRLRAMLRNL